MKHKNSKVLIASPGVLPKSRSVSFLSKPCPLSHQIGGIPAIPVLDAI